MDITLIIIIAITALISYTAFNNFQIFQQYKFEVSSILYKKEYIRLLSSGFLHADWMHFFFNMFGLYIFGPIVINFFGITGFLIIYLGSILLGNLLSLYIYQKQGWYSAVGASGGVSGVIFSAIAMYPDLPLTFIFLPFFDIPGYIFGLLYFGYSVYSMVNPQQNDNIGHAAHLGGAAFGLFYAITLEPESALQNALKIGAMSLPLFYMVYYLFNKKLN